MVLYLVGFYFGSFEFLSKVQICLSVYHFGTMGHQRRTDKKIGKYVVFKKEIS